MSLGKNMKKKKLLNLRNLKIDYMVIIFLKIKGRRVWNMSLR